MTITKTCNTCEHYPNDKHCIGCEWDKNKGENTKWELKENPIVIERKVLEQIRAEIESHIIESNGLDFNSALYIALEIIDKHLK